MSTIMYITENGLGVDLFVHLSVICDICTVVQQIGEFLNVYLRSRDVGVTGFVYYVNDGTGLNDIIEHELICSVMHQYCWLTTEINDWNEYNLCFSFFDLLGCVFTGLFLNVT